VRASELHETTSLIVFRGLVLTAALITFEFFSSGFCASRLVLTDHITSFVGPEGCEGHRTGLSQALDNLHAMLAG
jgi:hypothetical protein